MARFAMAFLDGTMCEAAEDMELWQFAMDFMHGAMKTTYGTCYGGKKEWRMFVDRHITRSFYNVMFCLQTYVAQVLHEAEFKDRFAAIHVHEWAELEDAFEFEDAFDP